MASIPPVIQSTPGIYFLRVDLGADAGDDKALRTIAVAY
jgi:hypothetical protein